MDSRFYYDDGGLSEQDITDYMKDKLNKQQTVKPKTTMEKKAKITRTTFKQEWKGDKGSVFYHDIELDNGDKGSIGAKEQMPAKLNPGQELTYTIEAGQHGNKIKAVAPAGGSGGFGGSRKGPEPKTQIIGFAMSYTKDLVVADKVNMDHLPSVFQTIYKLMADKL
jgi:hypothetical protein